MEIQEPELVIIDDYDNNEVRATGAMPVLGKLIKFIQNRIYMRKLDKHLEKIKQKI